MSIVVTKCLPDVVCPSEPGTPTGKINLSSFDIFLGCVPVPLLLVFDKPITNPVNTIRRALSQALVQYYPICGRLATGADGRVAITCTGDGQGVLFAGASASCAVNNVVLSSLSTGLLKDLLLEYPEELCRDADALLLMQVTEFSCGGFAVGVTWNHVLADGAGMGQFLQALGELTRGMSMSSVVPVRLDDSVLAAARPQGGVAAMEFPPAGFTEGMSFLDFTIPSRLITRVKALFTAGECTVFEAVVALLWRCRARAVTSGDEVDTQRPTSVVFGYNMRGLAGAAGGYYGNCLIQVVAVATSAEVAYGDIKDVVKLIQMAKKKILLQDEKDPVPAAAVRHEVGYNTLMVTSWRNLGLEAPDFGGGTPARVIWYMQNVLVPFVVLCPPCKGKDGVNVMGYVGKKEHVDAFMLELDMAAAR